MKTPSNGPGVAGDCLCGICVGQASGKWQAARGTGIAASGSGTGIAATRLAASGAGKGMIAAGRPAVLLSEHVRAASRDLGAGDADR